MTVPEWTLGDRLDKALRHAKVSNQQMADYLGVSRNTIGNYTADRTRPTDGVLRAWAQLTQVPFEWLKSGSD